MNWVFKWSRLNFFRKGLSTFFQHS